MSKEVYILIASILVALGVTTGGGLIGKGLFAARNADRYVTVKGIAEQEVQASMAIWPLRLSAANDNLLAAQTELERSVKEIKEFLLRQGIDPAAARTHAYSVSDARTNQYSSGAQSGSRYVIQQTVIVRSNDPEKVRVAAERINQLVARGVVLTSGGEYGAAGPSYIFTGLNELKPKMIATATARARESAAQFARDSNSILSGIRRANQGIFEILPRDPVPGVGEEGQIHKTVRIVTTVEYQLQN
jgi:uncharacterized protein